MYGTVLNEAYTERVFYTSLRRTYPWASVSCAIRCFAFGETMASQQSPTYTCWICGNRVQLEKCKSDEEGRARGVLHAQGTPAKR